jgi:hypothetical protein
MRSKRQYTTHSFPRVVDHVEECRKPHMAAHLS